MALDNKRKSPSNADKQTLRRFATIGTKEEMDKFYSLVERKNLSREDLTVILHAVKLNPNKDYNTKHGGRKGMDAYLETMLGKKKALEVMHAVRAGRPIMITGEQQTGRSTLCNYINSIGGNAVEDFHVCIVTLEKPLEHMIPNFLETIP